MKEIILFCRKHRWKIGLLIIIPLAFFSFSRILLKRPLFNNPVCLVVEDRNGNLIGAKIASDGQWRFPFNPEVPEKFKQASICFEDKRYFSHLGVDFLAMGRAVRQNFRAGKIVSGGSTITMQVVRLSRQKNRNIVQKTIEIFLSIYLELCYSKEEIFAIYTSHAPFGGNVVGLDAAAWRYFGKKASDLSYGEAAALAVLPNSPSLVHPGKNRNTLLSKRDLLLDKMQSRGIIDSETCKMAKLESLPSKPLALPNYAPQLVNRIYFEKFGKSKFDESKFITTIDLTLQKQVLDIIQRQSERWIANGVNNAAALVLSVETGDVLAYVGNTYKGLNDENQNDVDVTVAARSPGSTLKPLLYTAMLTDGLILPTSLVPDIPTQIASYSPKNFDLEYDGAVPARKALARSLNVPAVRMLRLYGVERFHHMLKRMGMTTINKPAGHYGLSLILGGGESSVWELSGIYSSMSRMLNHYTENSSRYDPLDWHMPVYLKTDTTEMKQRNTSTKVDEEFFVSAGSVWSAFDAMEDVMRPGEEALWKEFNISQKIAWKTGTSYGYRDAWSIGCTPEYTIAVWVGNADGEGRPGLTGISAAAPMMFDILSLLPSSDWFAQPYDDMENILVCRESGYRALEICTEKDSVWIPKQGLKTSACPYHQLVHLDAKSEWRVNSECESTSNMIHKSWFVLPPTMEWFYKDKNYNYKPLPKYRPDCAENNFADEVMELIYPKLATRIYVPIEIDGTPGKTIFEVAHRNSSVTIYWHLDEIYMGQTKSIHQMALNPPVGKHVLSLVDEYGGRLMQNFEIIGKN
ncbi:MAG: penicillin-binding protein 1C [Bacteroidia bacterium]|nr:penicillin-binding protein 1C [Bacteroidia bacterium]